MRMSPIDLVRRPLLAGFLVLFLLCAVTTAQDAGRRRRIRDPRLSVEYVHYRPVRYETEKVREPQNERPNQGGLVFAYLKNTSGESVRMRAWHLNRRDDSHYRLGGSIAWDRIHKSTLQPAEMTVPEISGISGDFATDAPFEFALIGANWRSIGGIETTLREDPVGVSFIRVFPDRNQVEVHVRNAADESVRLEGADVIGTTVQATEWTTQELEARGRRSVGCVWPKPCVRGGCFWSSSTASSRRRPSATGSTRWFIRRCCPMSMSCATWAGTRQWTAG